MALKMVKCLYLIFQKLIFLYQGYKPKILLVKVQNLAYTLIDAN